MEWNEPRFLPHKANFVENCNFEVHLASFSSNLKPIMSVLSRVLYRTYQYQLKAASNHILVWQHPSCILDGIDISYSSRVNSNLIRKIIEIFEFLIVEKQSYRIKLQLSLLQSVIQIFLVKQIACTMQRKLLKFSLKDSMNNPYHDCVSRRSKLNMDTLLERFSNWCWLVKAVDQSESGINSRTDLSIWRSSRIVTIGIPLETSETRIPSVGEKARSSTDDK